MPILFVCHSTGDTNVLLSTARKVIEESNEIQTHFLIVGQAADRACNRLEENDLLMTSGRAQFTTLSNLLDIEMQDEMHTEQLEPVQAFLNQGNFTTALIGTPSSNVTTPFQIAEMLTASPEFQGGIHYNDYLLDEPEHTYWKMIEENKPWQQHYTWHLPLPKAEAKFKSINDSLSTEVVGHPSIDAAIQNLLSSTDQVAAIRDNLQIDDTNAFIFMSGSKDLEGDESCLLALLTIIEDSDAIRIGLHPGAKNLVKHIEALASIIETAQNPLQFKFIITNGIKEQIKAEELKNETHRDLKKIIDPLSICDVEIKGDQAALASDAVASDRPATLVTQAAITKPAYCHNTERESFLPDGLLSVGKNELGLFRERINQRRQPEEHEAANASKKTTEKIKYELDLPEETAAEIMATYLLSNTTPG